MSIYNYLQLQPVDPQDDGSVSDLDQYQQDEKIDLQNDIDEETLNKAWSQIEDDFKKEPLNFSDSQK
jgi:hypothetical protein